MSQEVSPGVDLIAQKAFSRNNSPDCVMEAAGAI
jgi:hypothetical protein